MEGQLHLKLGKTFRYQEAVDSLVGRGAYGRVFTGHFKSNQNKSWEMSSGEGKVAAIKRVEIKGKWTDVENDREFIALKELRHPFIVSLYAVEDDDDFRNFIFELCQANLEEFITKKYNGVMPQDIEGLYQMASGLQFIHEKKMIHRDIKPENVLISSAGRGAWLKIADLGFSKPLKEDGIHYNLASGLKGTEHYMAPELLGLRNLNGRVPDCTIASDVFAAGCTFFRYLAEGLHLFGKGFNIEVNIMAGIPINKTEYGGEQWKTDIIENMTKFNPEERPSFFEIVKLLDEHLPANALRLSLEVISPPQVVKNSRPDETQFVGNNIQFDRSKMLGSGDYGTVFRGEFNGKKVAIKRTLIMDDRDYITTELINNKKFHNHPNIVQLLHFEEDSTFRYFVLELCVASLADFCNGKYKGPMPTDEQVLFQLASGLEYIHSMGILHRGVKPQNILISLTKPVRMKYCGFGWSKSVNERGTCSLSSMKGSQNWMSPEELHGFSNEIKGLRGSVTSEIFSAGCVFIFFLLRGKHPFGHSMETTYNIMKGNPINVKELPEYHFVRPFVIQMIAHKPENRISLLKVIEHLKPLQPPSRLSLLQYEDQNRLCSTGTVSRVYHVATWEGLPLAVKRVPLQDCTTKSFEQFKQFKHVNIVHLLHFDRDEVYIYFGMEWCDASLDQLFLPEEDVRKYKDPIPSDEQFCLQLISGLEYIHRQGLVHGSIKPTNILMSSSKDPQIKLSDFGLTASRLNEGHTTQRFIAGFLSSRYWLAAELLESKDGQNKPTKESDIFAAGSVFFYFMSKGVHLFGNESHTILKNTLSGNQFNLFNNQTQTNYSRVIHWMTTKEPKQRSTLLEVTDQMKLFQSIPPISSIEKLKKIGSIQYSRENSHIIGTGGQASVFVGFSNGLTVAVKRITIDCLENEAKKSKVYRERDSFKKLNHRNIIKLFDYAENNTFMVLALEKCLTSVDYYCRNPNVCRTIPMPSDREVLLQMAQGLDYIHRRDLIHRDVKPENILISGDNPAIIKWADFGMSRAVITGSKTFSWSKLQGTDRWLAPELISATREDKIKGSQKCDVFALGCVFFFFLVPGIHPFGDNNQNSTQNNICDKKTVNFHRLPNNNFAFNIIQGMVENDRERRSKIPDVVQKLLDFEVCNDLGMMSPSPVKKPRKEK